jgi:hypothetical protein
MDKQRAAALAVRSEQIKTTVAASDPTLLPDKPVVPIRSIDPEHLQLQARLPSGTTPLTRLRP